MAAEDVLVTTQWVADHLNDARVKLVEVDVDINAYGEGHAPGAIGWNWTSQLQDQLRRDIITKPDLEQLLGASGVSNDDTIVLYGDNNNWFAAYAFWVLEMYGHRNLRLMDGGRKKWLDEGRPTTKDAPSPRPDLRRVAGREGCFELPIPGRNRNSNPRIEWAPAIGRCTSTEGRSCRG